MKLRIDWTRGKTFTIPIREEQTMQNQDTPTNLRTIEATLELRAEELRKQAGTANVRFNTMAERRDAFSTAEIENARSEWKQFIAAIERQEAALKFMGRMHDLMEQTELVSRIITDEVYGDE